jgi:hypothetical protein
VLDGAPAVNGKSSRTFTLAPLDDVEHKHLLPAERAANVRLL